MNGDKQEQKKNFKIALIVSVIVLFFVLYAVIAGGSSKSGSTKASATPTTEQKDVRNAASLTPTPTPDTTFAILSFNNSGVTIRNTENVPLKSCQLTSGYYQNFPGVQMNHDDWYEYDIKDDILPLQTTFVSWSWMTLIDNGTRFNYYQQAPENLMVECLVNGQDAFSMKVTEQR
jgi:hypothetical protein